MKRALLAMLAAGMLLVASGSRAGVVPCELGDETPEPKPGDRGAAFTAIRGHQVEEIPVTYLGVLEDFAGPGYDLHLVELEGPVGEHIGVASGMSGSPVCFDGKIIGALSYRLGGLPRDAVAGVTPIRDVLDAARSMAATAPRADAAASPILTPVSSAGLSAQVRAWVGPQLEEMGFHLGVGNAGAGELAGVTLAPGSPVGVALVRGDLSIAASGTVTWIDGDRVYAFGHPFFGSGRVEMPMLTASVIHTLADELGSSKLAGFGDEVGAIVEDRLTAVVGRTGVRARMIPLSVRVAGADYGPRTFRFEVVRHSNFAPVLAAASVANALLSNIGFDRRATMLARGSVRLRGREEIPLDMAFAGEDGNHPALRVGGTLQLVLNRLWTNPFEEVDIEAIDLEVQAIPEVMQYRFDTLIYDRGAIRPGQRLEVECILSLPRGESVRHKLSLDVPDDLRVGRTLMLSVGSPEQLERALGRPLTRRLQTAKQLSTVVDVLSQMRSAHRLQMVLHEPAPGIVARGESFTELPPTAARLLSAGGQRGRSSRGGRADLARGEIELDGPVTGGHTVRLRLDPALRDQQETLR